MGSEFEVRSWVPERIPGTTDEIKHVWEQIYYGDSFKDAFTAMINEKNKGIGCVEFKWR